MPVLTAGWVVDKWALRFLQYMLLVIYKSYLFTRNETDAPLVSCVLVRRCECFQAQVRSQPRGVPQCHEFVDLVRAMLEVEHAPANHTAHHGTTQRGA